MNIRDYFNIRKQQEISDIEKTKTLFAHQALFGFMIISIPTLIVSVSRLLFLNWNPAFLIFILGGISPYIVFLFYRKLHYKIIIGLVLVTLSVIGVTGFLNYSFFSVVVHYFFYTLIFSVVFFGKRVSFIVLALQLLYFLTVFFLYKSGKLHFDIDFNNYNQQSTVWLTHIVSFVAFSIIAIILFGKYYETLYDNLNKTKKQSEELMLAFEKVDESDRLKTAFLQNLSHEIRTPLYAIAGFSELLKDEELSKETLRNYTELITANSNKLIEIISDVVDISQIHTNSITVNKLNFDIIKAISGIVSEFEPRIQEKNIAFAIVPEKLPQKHMVFTDETKVIKVLKHLFDNALKFTEKGQICFEIKFHTNFILFLISDTGIGIPLVFQQQIFEPFRKAESVSDNIYGGTGLGLAISKAYIGLLKGTLSLESEPGIGTNITVRIPTN